MSQFETTMTEVCRVTQLTREELLGDMLPVAERAWIITLQDGTSMLQVESQDGECSAFVHFLTKREVSELLGAPLAEEGVP